MRRCGQLGNNAYFMWQSACRVQLLKWLYELVPVLVPPPSPYTYSSYTTDMRRQSIDFDLLPRGRLPPSCPPTHAHKSNFRRQQNRNRNRRIDTKEIKNSNKFLTLRAAAPAIWLYLDPEMTFTVLWRGYLSLCVYAYVCVCVLVCTHISHPRK